MRLLEGAPLAGSLGGMSPRRTNVMWNLSPFLTIPPSKPIKVPFGAAAEADVNR